MKRIAAVFVIFLTPFFLKGQEDSVFITQLDQIPLLEGKKVRVMVIDLVMPKNFNYQIFPDSLEGLYFLKPNPIPLKINDLLNKIVVAKHLELNGKIAEWTPFILAFCENIEILKISNIKLSKIWREFIFLKDINLPVLYLKNVKIDNKCKTYKKLVLGSVVTVDKVYIETEKEISHKKIVLALSVFNARMGFVNEEPY
ncbi:MAG: hypothetical protein JJU02_17065 [Cryomorphaceae bacterium]|nr:hypothetical protein [Cryomorphaceae bacterium]